MAEQGWPEGLARRLERISPITAFLAWLVAGVILILLSFGCNLSAVVRSDGLKLGYLYEINWIWNFGFLVPFAMAGVFLTISSARQAVLGLVSAGMISDARGNSSTMAAAEQSWYTMFGKFLRWTVWASVAGVAISYVEWAVVSVRPLLSGSLGRSGWFVASLINGTPTWENIGFGFLAYTMQGLSVALFLLFIFTVAAFASWIYRFTTQDEPLELLPDTTSDDKRRGFQVLEPFVTNMLYGGLGFFLVFFVNRIHFLFLNQTTSPPPYSSVYDFFVGEVLGAMGKDLVAIFNSEGTRFFEIGGGDNFTVVITTIGLFCVVGISVLVPVTILLQAAQRARSRNLVFLRSRDQRALNPRRLSVDDQITRLNEMQVWPVNYPKPILLIALAIVAATSYVFYRLTFVLLTVCLVASFKAIVRVLRGLDAAATPEPGPQVAAMRPRGPPAAGANDGRSA